MVRDGTFREDLFYRLNVIVLRVPPLRERKRDISVLAEYFLKKYNSKLGKRLSLSNETLDFLSRYDWPGNVRELENILERAVILGEGPTIEPSDFNLNIDEVLKVEKVDMGKVLANESVRYKAQESEIKELSDLLIKTKGNIAEAARAMGLPRTTLFHRLRKYRLV
jgi:transcriptional regulator with PAS, ATPase and Fis domain